MNIDLNFLMHITAVNLLLRTK